ncbi:hypothetical protein FSP39_013570 [Pinctada imbricata]|uniref:Mitochondrial inner membrane protease ATP23 n=1 Tax=Pinctada imbricata TaxID=66713 RepID=A0AA89BM02_PINIB|nr:hypothetical protein FSP39_013570 [Pinctada imbricata]
MGGFDSNTNQVVICQNNAVTQAMQCRTLLHELIHAFDKCRAHVDFSNIHHLACTEIRAAAFTKCSLMSKLVNGYTNHEECTRAVAEKAICTVRNVTEEEARQAVSEVFTRCYNDTEPFGRHFKHLRIDPRNCLSENEKYGYTKSFSHIKDRRKEEEPKE